MREMACCAARQTRRVKLTTAQPTVAAPSVKLEDNRRKIPPAPPDGYFHVLEAGQHMLEGWYTMDTDALADELHGYRASYVKTSDRAINLRVVCDNCEGPACKAECRASYWIFCGPTWTSYTIPAWHRCTGDDVLERDMGHTARDMAVGIAGVDGGSVWARTEQPTTGWVNRARIPRPLPTLVWADRPAGPTREEMAAMQAAKKAAAEAAAAEKQATAAAEAEAKAKAKATAEAETVTAAKNAAAAKAAEAKLTAEKAAAATVMEQAAADAKKTAGEEAAAPRSRSALAVGAHVTISGLASHQEYNGQAGVVVGGLDPKTDSQCVKLDVGGAEVNLRPANLTAAAAAKKVDTAVADAKAAGTAVVEKKKTEAEKVAAKVEQEEAERVARLVEAAAQATAVEAKAKEEREAAAAKVAAENLAAEKQAMEAVEAAEVAAKLAADKQAQEAAEQATAARAEEERLAAIEKTKADAKAAAVAAEAERVAAEAAAVAAAVAKVAAAEEAAAMKKARKKSKAEEKARREAAFNRAAKAAEAAKSSPDDYQARLG